MAKGDGKKIAVGALLAGAVGYVAGILTAPKSGKETRQDVKKTAVRVKKEAETKLKRLHSELTTLIATVNKETKKLGTKAKKEVQASLKKADASKTKVKEMLSAIHEGGADDKDLDRAIKDATKAVDSLKKFTNK